MISCAVIFVSPIFTRDVHSEQESNIHVFSKEHNFQCFLCHICGSIDVVEIP